MTNPILKPLFCLFTYIACLISCTTVGFVLDHVIAFISGEQLDFVMTSLSFLTSFFILAPIAVRRVSEWLDLKDWQRNARCPHGVPRGASTGACSRCRAQQLQAKEERRAREQARNQELEEQMRRYDMEAAASRFNQGQYKAYIQRQSRNIDFLRSVSPQKFEDLIAEMFTALGWAVEQTPYTNDSGMDAILQKDNRKFLLECKRYGKDNAVGRPTLNAFLGVMTAQKAEGGFFVTTSRFSFPAKEFAKDNGITPIDSTSLLLMMDKAYPAKEDAEMLRLMCSVCGDIVDFQDADDKTLSYKKGRLCRNEHIIEDKSISLLLKSNLPASKTKVAKPVRSQAAKRSSKKSYRRRY